MKFSQAVAGLTLIFPLATMGGSTVTERGVDMTADEVISMDKVDDNRDSRNRRDRVSEQIKQTPTRKLNGSPSSICGTTVAHQGSCDITGNITNPGGVGRINLTLIAGTTYTFVVERITCGLEPISQLLLPNLTTLATPLSEAENPRPASCLAGGLTNSGDPVIMYEALQSGVFLFETRPTIGGCPAGETFDYQVTTTCDIPTGTGGVQGDPHFKTWRGQHFDFHGECDLILLHSSTFELGLGLDVHIRTHIRRDMSYISSATLRIGTDILEVESNGVYYLNGVAGAELPNEFSGFTFSHTHPTDAQHVFEVQLGGRECIKVKTYKDFVSVLIEQGHNEHFGKSVGLMGNFGMGQMVARDGKTIIEDANVFGQEWQVLDSEPKLFHTMRFPQHPQVCTMPTPAQATSQLRRRLSEETSVDELAAEKACEHWGEEGKDDCVFDVLTTGDLTMAVVGAY
jgi:hypothetical protein